MASDMDDAVRKIRKGVRGIARSSPVVAAGEAIGKVGEKVIEHTPEPIKRYGRTLRSELQGLLGRSGQRRRIRQHQRLKRKSAASRKGSRSPRR